MVEFSGKVEVINKHGLHARPATQFVRVANGYSCDISVVFDGTEVNGKSVIEMMTLGAECGALLVITARGKNAPEAVTALQELVSSWDN